MEKAARCAAFSFCYLTSLREAEYAALISASSFSPSI